MTLYKLLETDREENGPSDSDWYNVVYDSEQDKIYRVETGSTRYANALYTGPAMEKPTAEIMVLAEAVFVRIIFPMIKSQYQMAVLEPKIEKLTPGTRVRTKAKGKSQVKEFDTEKCNKCDGTGKWINPKRSDDVRQCFACNGLGYHKKNFRKKLDAAGKVCWQHFEAGLTGIVVSQHSYGVFYRNGYNQRDRSNTSVVVKIDDGTEISISAAKLQLDEDIKSDDQLMVEAKKLASYRNFHIPFTKMPVF